jgi:hypothetical protein
MEKEPPGERSPQEPAGVGDCDRLTNEAEIQKGKYHFAGQDFEEAFHEQEGKAKEAKPKDELVPPLCHQVARGNGHEPVGDPGQTAQPFHGH